jgi:malic enzyme
MHRVDGEDYGRGYIEQYYGDLVSLESLSKSIVEAAAASAKVLFMVNPVGTTRPKKLAQSPNGAIVEGNAGDVTVLQVNKAADLSVALQTMGQINERLSYAFLLTEASIRNAERVTAEEVRLVTQSIERQLGGIYSLLSQEFQLPLVQRIMDRLIKTKKMPKINKDFITPTIVTGIDALGRGNDLNRLDIYLQGIAQILGPGGLQQYIDFREYMNRRAAALGIDTAGLVKSEEQIAQEQQMAMQQQLLQQMGPQAAQTMGNIVERQQTQ